MSGTVSNVAAGFRSPEPPNMLGQLGTIANIGHTLATTRHQTAEFEGREAIGAALQDAMNPETGEVDYAKFKGLIEGNPMAAYMAPQALLQARALQLGGVQVQQQQAVLGMQRLNNLRQTLGGLLANPTVSRQEVINSVGSLLALPEDQRPFSPQVAAQALATLPENPAAIRQWLMQHMMSTDAGIAHAANFLPRPGAINIGGEIQQTVQDPITGRVERAPGGASTLPVTPTPGERNEPTQTIDPSTGRPRIQTRQDALPMHDGQGRPISSPGAAASPFGTGRHPGGARQQPPGAPPAGAPAAPTPPAQAQTGWAPGEAEAERGVAERGAAQSAELARLAADVPNQDATLQNLEQFVEGFASGPASPLFRQAAGLWNQIAPNALQIQPREVANQEEFNKQAFQLANQQFTALGGTGTDGQLAAVMGTSPNEVMSYLGNRGIIALLRGNNRAIQVKNQAWQEWLASGHGANTWNSFNAEFNRNYNPRIFQMLYIRNPEDRRKVWEAMSTRDKENYARGLVNAFQAGWINPSEMGAPSNGR